MRFVTVLTPVIRLPITSVMLPGPPDGPYYEQIAAT